MTSKTLSWPLCMILIVSYLSKVSQGATPRPTSRPTDRPTDRPTAKPTESYQTLFVTYNMAEVDDNAFMVLEASETGFKDDIEESVFEAIDDVSNANMDLVSALADEVTAVETDQTIDVDMEIRYYYTEATEIRKSQESNAENFQNRLQELLKGEWNLTSIVVTVDLESIKTSADMANTLSHVVSVITVGIFSMIMV